MHLHIVVLVVGLVACKSERGSEPEPPPPAPAYPLVAKTDAAIPLAKVPVPSRVVWMNASGAVETAAPGKVWDGSLPTGRTPITLDALAELENPPPPPEPEMKPVDPGAPSDRVEGQIKFAKNTVDPALAREQAIRTALEAGIFDSERGFERALAARGGRDVDAATLLLFAPPGTPSLPVVQLVTRLGARLGVVQKGDQLAALRLAFKPAQLGYVLDDKREVFVEIHLDANGADVLSLPSNGHTLLPWAKGTIDAGALRAVYQGFGKDPVVKLDVFVTRDVPYQRLIDTLIVLDEAGVTALGLGESPGPVEGRVAQIVALRNARATSTSATAALSLGQPNAQGDLDKALIRRVMRLHLKELLACYDGELAKTPGLSGTVNTQFFITPNGDVAMAAATGVAPAVSSCIAAELKKFLFPKPKGGGGVQVNYPMTFRPRDT